MGPENVIMGDGNPLELPTTQVEEQQLNSEKNLAKFSRTAEFKKLKEALEAKIEYYQKYLPDGRPIATTEVSGEDWRIANIVIGEFQNIINVYETANESVQAKKNEQ